MAATTGDSEVIKEFLISLGFKIDEAGMKKFGNSLTNATKGAMGVGGSLLAAAFAVEKFVERIADGMEKLFYASQRTGASVSNIKAVEGAFQSAGFAAGKGTEFIEQFAESLRANPGINEFVRNTFGIDPDTMDKTEAFIGVMTKLSDMAKKSPGDYAIAAQQANMVFGMSDRDFKTAIENIDKIRNIEEDRKALLRAAGVDQEKLAKDSVDFNNNLRKMGAELGVIGNQFAEVLMPAVNSALKGISWFLEKSVTAVSALTHATKEDWMSAAAATSDAAMNDPDLAEQMMKKAARTPEAIAAGLESQLGIVPGLMSAVRNVESGGGKNLEGPVVNGQQAFGPYQISDSNFKNLGIGKSDAMDEEKSAKIWAEMFSNNLKMFHGDQMKALAAMNSNPSHVKRAVEQWGDAMMDGLPTWLLHMQDETGNNETLNYVTKVANDLGRARAGKDAAGGAARKNTDGTPQANAGSVNITQSNTYNITGTDAEANGKAVAEHNKRKLGDATRDARGLLSTPGRAS
jgi:Transglycosylase SLT domain